MALDAQALVAGSMAADEECRRFLLDEAERHLAAAAHARAYRVLTAEARHDLLAALCEREAERMLAAARP